MIERFSASKISSPSAILLIIRIEYPTMGKPVSTNHTRFQTYENCRPQRAQRTRRGLMILCVLCALCGYSSISQTDGVLSGSASLGYNLPIQFPAFPSLPKFHPATIPTTPLLFHLPL